MLIRFITEVSQYGLAKASEFLRHGTGEGVMNDEYGKAVEIGEKLADLQRQIDELRRAQEPKPEFKPKLMPRFDPTEGFRMPGAAAREMARVVPDVKGQGFNAHAWAQTKISGPGGFGPPPETKGQEAKKKEKEARVEKVEEPPRAQDNRSAQTRIFDAMVDYWAGAPNDTSKLR